MLANGDNLMSDDISLQEMYRLLNEAVSQCYNHKDNAVNRDMQSFQKRYQKMLKTNPQLTIFDNPIPSAREVRQAAEFCDLLDDYRISVDVFNKDEVYLGQDFYRQLYNGIEQYRPHIFPENKAIFNALDCNVRRKLPEFKYEFILSDYNERALEVCRLKKTYDKNKSSHKAYEKMAHNLFKDIYEKKELSNIPHSVDKLTTYSNILKAVDCLPTEKYKRTAKYQIKYSINMAIVGICKSLGENYALARINAEQNAIKYLKALRNAQSYAKSKNNFSSYRAQRQQDEYLYK